MTATATTAKQRLDEVLMEEAMSCRGHLEYVEEQHGINQYHQGAHRLLCDLILSQRTGGMCAAIRRFHTRTGQTAHDTAFGKGYGDMYSHMCVVHNHYLTRLP